MSNTLSWRLEAVLARLATAYHQRIWRQIPFRLRLSDPITQSRDIAGRDHDLTLACAAVTIDHGSQLTSEIFTSLLQKHGIRISMDGKSQRVDNVFIEWLWRSMKHKEVYPKAYNSIARARDSIRR